MRTLSCERHDTLPPVIIDGYILDGAYLKALLVVIGH
jgi:hypothetical protein